MTCHQRNAGLALDLQKSTAVGKGAQRSRLRMKGTAQTSDAVLPSRKENQSSSGLIADIPPTPTKDVAHE